MEVEVKLRIVEDELPALREALSGMGASSTEPVRQEDIFFQHPSRDFVASDEAFRLRRVGDALELTYKGARLPGDHKSRPEHNVSVQQDPMAMLEALGFTPSARLCKHREAWHVAQAEVVLDHVEGLGWFVEIEAEAGIEAPEERIQELREALGLSDHEAVVTSYLELALESGAAAAQRL